MQALANALKEVLYGTWPMIALSCVVFSLVRVAYLIKNKEKFFLSNELMMLTFIVYILCMFLQSTTRCSLLFHQEPIPLPQPIHIHNQNNPN